MTTFEQRAELNHLVDPTIPLTWHHRWARVRVLLPILMITVVFLWEMILFAGWLSGWSVLSMVASSAGVALVVLGSFFLLVEFGLRSSHHSKRRIELLDKRAIIGGHQLRWEQIKTWRFEPIPSFPGYSKLTIALMLPKRPKRPGYWPMVLENPQVRELISELESQKQRRQMNYEIQVLGETQPPITPGKVSIAGMWLYAGGFLLLMHGGPMLVSGLDNGHSESGQDRHLSPERAAKLARFLHAHFSSTEQFQHFWINLGATLTLLGFILLAWGWILMSRAQNQSEQDQGRQSPGGSD